MTNNITLTSSSFSLTSIRFDSTELDVITAQLQQKQAEAPALFSSFPCIIDLFQLSPEHFDLTQVISACRQHGFLPLAVHNAQDVWEPLLQQLNIANLGVSRSQTNKAKPVRSLHSHRGNVRSGQQVFHDGDLIIFGMVSAGAEVLATGDLHIFGTLRGRALAGIKGDESAFISCQHFDPELVAIAGQYRLFEDNSEATEQPVAIQLYDGNLNISSV